MSVWTGRATIVGTGAIKLTTGSFLPTWCHIEALTDESYSSGNFDGTRQNCLSKFDDNSSSNATNVNTHTVDIKKKVTGVLQPRVLASCTGFSMVGSLGAIDFNVSNFDTTVQINIICGD